MLRTRCGTQGYIAPELLGLLPRRLRGRARHEFSHAIDMWSLGCLLHEMLTSQTPFLQADDDDDDDGFTDMTGLDFIPDTDMEALHEYCQGRATFPIEILQASGVSRYGIGLIKRLLMANPTERPTAIRALQFRWLIDDESIPGGDWGASTRLRLRVTQVQCFNSLREFLDGWGGVELRVFYKDDDLKKLASAAKKMVETLFDRGCGKEVALHLSILILYDMVVLIGLPRSLLSSILIKHN